MFAGHLAVRISRDAIYVYSVDRFQWNLPHVFVMWAVGIAE